MSGINDSQSQFRVDRWSVEIGIELYWCCDFKDLKFLKS